MSRILLSSVVCAATLTFLSPVTYGGDLKYKLLTSETLTEQLKNAPSKNSDRAAELKRRFEQAGCQPAEQAVKHLHEPNVLCVLRGASESVILVGAHLDRVDEGQGIVDDWSGASMLPELYETLANEQRSHTFVFIGFAGEEQGLIGSEFYTRQMAPADREHLLAMVNLECLGLSSTEVWVSHSDPTLVHLLLSASHLLKVPLKGVNVDQIGTDDAQSFTRYKVPHVTIHSVTQETVPILHTSKDNFKAIKPDDYYESYRLITTYLAMLDELLPTNSNPPENPK